MLADIHEFPLPIVDAIVDAKLHYLQVPSIRHMVITCNYWNLEYNSAHKIIIRKNNSCHSRTIFLLLQGITMMKKILSAVVLVCIFVLLLPTHCNPDGFSWVPWFLHLGSHQKMLAAFLLGDANSCCFKITCYSYYKSKRCWKMPELVMLLSFPGMNGQQKVFR